MFEVVKDWADRYLSDEEAAIFAFLIILSIAVFFVLGTILAPLFISVVFAFVLQGAVKNLSSYQIPRKIAFLATYIVFLCATFGFFLVVVPRVLRQAVNLLRELPDMVLEGQALLLKLPEYYPDLVSGEQVADWLQLISAEIAQVGQAVVSFSISLIPLLATISIYALMVPILVFFLLKDRDQLVLWFQSLLPTERKLMNRIGTEMNQQMANYVRGKVVEILVVGVITFLLFRIFDLEYAALLALLVGISVIIPYFGVVIVTVPVAVVAYVQFGWTSDLFYLFLGYTIIQSLDGMVLVPLLFSEVVNLHPVAIIAAVIIFGSLWGFWGVFFAIPLATFIKAILNAWPRHDVDTGIGDNGVENKDIEGNSQEEVVA